MVINLKRVILLLVLGFALYQALKATRPNDLSISTPRHVPESEAVEALDNTKKNIDKVGLHNNSEPAGLVAWQDPSTPSVAHGARDHLRPTHHDSRRKDETKRDQSDHVDLKLDTIADVGPPLTLKQAPRLRAAQPTFYQDLAKASPEERRVMLKPFQQPVPERNVVTVAMCDYSWIEFCENLAWHHHRALPQTPLLMNVMDRKTMEWCSTHLATHVPVVCVYPPTTTIHKKRGCHFDAMDDAFWAKQEAQMSGKWMRIVTCKMEALRALLVVGVNIFFEDSDAALLVDPFAFLPLKHSWEGACHGTYDHKHIEPPVRNTGMMFLQSNKNTIAALQQVIQACVWPGGNDQHFFNAAADNKALYGGRTLDSWCAPLDRGGGRKHEKTWAHRAQEPGWLWHIHATGYKTPLKKAWLQKYGYWQAFPKDP